MEIKERGNWGSQFGFIAAAAGSASWPEKYLEIPLYHRTLWWRSICISIFTFCYFSLCSHHEFRIIGRS